MKIYYFPLSARSVNDKLNINAAINSVLARPKGVGIALRDYRMMRDEVSPLCEVCGQVPYSDIHHIKPRWAWGFEIVMSNPPQNRDELYDLCTIAYQGLLSLPSEAHDFENLLAVCHSCHGTMEKESYRHWKEHFLAHYDRVVWNTNWTKEDRLKIAFWTANGREMRINAR